MTVYKIRYIAVILFIVSPFVVLAQQQNTDSISIFELMDAVEKNTSCRIYTTIATPFKVKKSETSKPTAESLRQALAATRYKVTVYADQIFILPETFLSTTLTPVLKGEQIKDSEQASSFIADAALAIVVMADPLASDVWIEDAAIASIMIQLQAEDLGLGSCWVQVRERFTATGMPSDEFVHGILDIPLQLQVLSVIAVGHKGMERKPFNEEHLQWEKIHINKFGGK